MLQSTNGVEVKDLTRSHAWFWEDNDKDVVISKDGLEHIAHHKYVAGHYTYLDSFCNPLWTKLTELLPMSLAPNMVTTLGGLHCLISYCTVWFYSKDYNKPVPDWLVLLCAYCTFAYYTLDCMDGKQARRTGTSSPLGQLFDHGFDCICNLSHVSNVAMFTSCGTNEECFWFFAMQGSLQFSFFMAQWEEYYTRVLPHAVGNYCGVTEVNYGMALLTLANVFIDRETFWTRQMSHILPGALISHLPKLVAEAELRHFGISMWIVMISFLILSSLYRVFCHVPSIKVRMSAVSKLLTPLLVALVPFFLPESIRSENVRKISVACGLLLSLLTKKMIIFSMAKMSYASIQSDAFPFLILCAWLRYDTNITTFGARTLLRGISLYHAFRLLRWAQLAIDQICKRLDIYCFTIKRKKD